MDSINFSMPQSPVPETIAGKGFGEYIFG